MSRPSFAVRADAPVQGVLRDDDDVTVTCVIRNAQEGDFVVDQEEWQNKHDGVYLALAGVEPETDEERRERLGEENGDSDYELRTDDDEEAAAEPRRPGATERLRSLNAMAALINPEARWRAVDEWVQLYGPFSDGNGGDTIYMPVVDEMKADIVGHDPQVEGPWPLISPQTLRDAIEFGDEIGELETVEQIVHLFLYRTLTVSYKDVSPNLHNNVFNHYDPATHTSSSDSWGEDSEHAMLPVQFYLGEAVQPQAPVHHVRVHSTHPALHSNKRARNDSGSGGDGPSGSDE